MKQKVVSKQITYCGTPATLFVEYGIDYAFARRYNQAPCFSITGDIYKRNKDGTTNKIDRNHLAGGCLHEEIVKAFPSFADLVKFHLRHADGSPSSPVENGRFMIECCLGREKWNDFSIERCFEWAADHFMVSTEEVREIVKEVEAAGEMAKAAKLAEMDSEEVVFERLSQKIHELEEMHFEEVRKVSQKCLEAAKESLFAPEFKEVDWSDRYNVAKKTHDVFDAVKHEAQEIRKGIVSARREAMNAAVARHVERLAPMWKAKAEELIVKYDLQDTQA